MNLRSLSNAILSGVLVLATLALPVRAQSIPGFPLPPACPPNTSCAPGTPPGGPGTCSAAPGGPTCGGGGPAATDAGSGINIGAGNPINALTGNKYQREVDLAPLPGVLGLELIRHYNSAYSRPNHSTGLIGRGWRLSYETELYATGSTLQIVQADGSRIIFNRDPRNPSLCASANPADGKLHVRSTARGNEYVWTWTNGRQLNFDAAGRLQQILAPTGEFVTLRHDARGLLTQVTDPQGRSLRLHYPSSTTAHREQRFGGVERIDTPVGQFTYQYGAGTNAIRKDMRAAQLASLTRVGRPDGIARVYHYEDVRFPTLLTGISLVEPGAAAVRLSTYGYDGDGKGNLTVRGYPARLQLDAKGSPLKPARLVPGTGIEQVTLDYSIGGQTTVTNSLGERTVYKHAIIAGQHRLLEVRGPGCAACGDTDRRYRYDAEGRLTETIELTPAGQPIRSTLAEYDALGRTTRLKTVEYADSKPGQPQWRVRYEYAGTNPEPAAIIRPSVAPGKEVRVAITYRPDRQPASITETGWSPSPDGRSPARQLERTTRYRYLTVNGRSLLAEIDGPLANGPRNDPSDSDVTRLTYDQTGSQLRRIVAPGNLITEIRARDAAQRPTQVAMTDGVRLALVADKYDIDGNLLTQTETAWRLDANGRGLSDSKLMHTHGYRYAPTGELVEELFDGATLQLHSRNAARREERTRHPDGSEVVHTLDTENRIVQSASFGPGASPAWLQQLSYSGYALARVTRFSLPAVLRSPGAVLPATETGALPSGGLPHSIASGGGAIELRRGAPGSGAESLVEEVVRADGANAQRWFDDFGRVVAIRYPERGVTVARYDEADQLHTLVDARGMRTEIARNVRGQPLDIRYFDRSGREESRTAFRYEGVSVAAERRHAEGVPDNETRVVSDSWGRPTTKQLVIFGQDGRPAVSMEMRRTLSPDGAMVAATLPSGARLGYRFDAGRRPVRIELDGTAVVRDARYIEPGITPYPVAYTFGNGLQAHTQFDEQWHLASHDTGLARLDFDTRPDGRIMRIRRYARANRGAGRVASLAPLLSWLPDATAQPANAPAPADSDETFAYADDGTLLSAPTPAHGDTDVDEAGNLTKHGQQTLHYNAAGELDRVSDAAGRVVARYAYDSQGIRISKTTDAGTEYFLHDDGRLIAEFDGRGAVVSEYVYLGDLPVAQLSYGPAGQSRQVYYLHLDQRQALDAVSDADARLVWQAGLDATGRRQGSTPARLESRFPLRLLGQIEDPETGLYYNIHRYYDPATSRYTQTDPLGIAPGLDLYRFAAGDPLARHDRLGLSPEPAEPGGMSRPWLFGTLVHVEMANQIRTRRQPFGQGWGANDARDGTWRMLPPARPLRPDAYVVSPADLRLENDGLPFKGTLWELKPSTWSYSVNSGKYRNGEGEVQTYVDTAKRGSWAAGSSCYLTSRLHGDEVPFDGKLWNITYSPDTHNDKSGLLFYSWTQQQEKPAPQTVPQPSLSSEDANRLQRAVNDIQAEGRREGWSTLEVVGMTVLIGLAIAAMLAVAFVTATAISAIVAGLVALIAAAAETGIGLAAALAAMFALGPNVAAAAEAKGQEKQQGLLDRTINWFRSWF
jgi:RHS repeat-associated protein